MKSKRVRIALGLFLVASTAYGMNAPDEFKVSKVQDGAAIAGLPTASIPQNPKGPVQLDNVVHFKGGSQIGPSQALDGSFNGSDDPRAVDGNATCTVFLNRTSMPMGGQLEGAPETHWATMTFQSGKKITVQQAVFNFTVADQWTMSRNQMICYKISSKPLTVNDLRQALGRNFQVQLSLDQSAEMAENENLKNILGGPNRSPGFSTQVSDQPGVKNVAPATPAPPASKDPVVDEDSSGGFVKRSATQSQVN